METAGAVKFESFREGVPATTAIGITPLPDGRLVREKEAAEERVLECSGVWRCERTTAINDGGVLQHDKSAASGRRTDDRDGRWKDDQRQGERGRRRRSRDRASSSDGSPSGSRRRSSDHHRRWLKPDKFDGKGSFETFLCTFQNCTLYNQWSDRDKLAYLRWSLTGIAAQLLCDADNLDCTGLVEKLRGRFGGKGMEERFQTELRCRRRHKGESLRELAQDIRRLMSLAYPGEKSGLAEHIARDAFLIALEDPEFELKIRECEPADLDTALKIAQRYEILRGLVDASSGIRYRVTRQVVEDGDSSALPETDLEARVAAVERQLQATSSTVQTQSSQQKSESSRKTGESTRGKRSDLKRNRAVNNEEREWKGQLLQKIKELESAQIAIREEMAGLVKENEALN